MRYIEYGVGNFKLSISQEHIAKMAALIKSAKTSETGGIIIGYYTDTDNVAVVTNITGPPPDSQSGRTWFKRGVQGLKKVLHDSWRQDEFYIGEWHFHPLGSVSPSGQDYKQMNEIAASKKYHCPEPVMIIIAGSFNQYVVQPYLTIQSDKQTYVMAKLN